VTEPAAQRFPSYDFTVLETLLTEARHFGFLGPGPVAAQIERSLAFTKMALDVPLSAADLGSGGGLPGLVLSSAWPTTHWLLIESNQRKAAWLEGAVQRLGAVNRVEVLCDRAENAGRSALRGRFDLVTARSFGPPATTAECAAPLLKLGSRLLVAEPPDHPPSRWPAKGLAELGLTLEKARVVSTAAGPASLSCLVAVSNCPLRYPRRVGIPLKRPLF
jgi:16S rRNA (guanine527-N7)-methyltransferase